MDQFDVVVIGAGARRDDVRGEAGQRGRSVLVVDHARQAGREDPHLRRRALQLHQPQRIAGELHLAAIPASAISALRRYTQADFVALVERYGIAYHEKTLGQLFCDGSSRQIVDLLLSEMRQANVELRLATCVRAVEKVSDGFALTLSQRCGALPLARRGIAAASRSRRWAPPASATISRSNSG